MRSACNVVRMKCCGQSTQNTDTCLLLATDFKHERAEDRDSVSEVETQEVTGRKEQASFSTSLFPGIIKGMARGVVGDWGPLLGYWCLEAVKGCPD